MSKRKHNLPDTGGAHRVTDDLDGRPGVEGPVISPTGRFLETHKEQVKRVERNALAERQKHLKGLYQDPEPWDGLS